MFFNIILPLLTLTAMYCLIIWGCVVVLRKIGIPLRKVILLSFLVFGTVTGLLSVWIWPKDLSTYFNVFGSFLGEEIYQLSIMYLGDASSDQAHYTIPWILRVPQIYAVASITFWGLAGLLTQFVYNKMIQYLRHIAISIR